MTTPTKPARGATDQDIVQAALERDYEVLAEIGRGGMATVYRARERMLEREVAIKVLPFTLAFDESLVERFLREARTSARLEHPHIIPIHRVGQSGQVTYFVMKLLRGQSLSERLHARGPLGADETRRILLDEAGRCVVTDFGIARSGSDSKLTSTGTSVGTPRYMSPEQARAKDVDGRSDIYSLGVVGYECLTGRTPFDGGDAFAILMEHISAPVPRPPLATVQDEALYAIIERMLEKHPDDRFGDAEQLTAALNGQVVSGATGARAATAPASNEPLYGTLGNGPRSAAALDRALDAGFAILRQQQPRVDAGLAAGKRAIAEHAPRVRTAVGRIGDAIVGGIAGVPARLAPIAARIAPTVARIAPIRAYALANRRRAAGMLSVIAAALMGAYFSLHFALHHRSRCPATSTAGRPSADSNGAAPPRPRPFTVMVDDGGVIRSGSGAEVYYDVCGLEKGTAFTTRVTITKNESGLNKLFGRAVAPVTEKYEESAGGPATRRHRSLDMDGMPGGSYWMNVTVTDARGRRREEGASLRVRGE